MMPIDFDTAFTFANKTNQISHDFQFRHTFNLISLGNFVYSNQQISQYK